MAYKSSAQRKFEAIQANNEQIAQQDYAGLTRTSSGWISQRGNSSELLGDPLVLKAGGLGSNVLDVAAAEPTPKTTGQEILKQAGQWAPLNTYYGRSAGSAIGSAIKTGTAIAKKAASQTPAVPQTTQGQTNAAGLGTGTGTGTTPKTYNVNGQQMTLGEYIRSLGAQNPNDAYRASVQSANAAYDRQRATYGAEAEALAGQGLGRSGSSDYLDSQAYAEKQRAISSAAASRDQQMATYAAGYSTYLQQEQAERQAQIESALERAVSMQLNTDNTVKYLMAMTGMTRSEAMRYAEAGTALTSAATEDTTKATLQEITNAYGTLTQQGMSSDAARQYLKGSAYGYDSALVDQAVNELVGAVEQSEADQLAASQKTAGEEFAKVLNSEAYSPEEASAILEHLGYSIAPDDKSGLLDSQEVANAITDAHAKGIISTADYVSLQRKNIDDTYDKLKENGSVGDLLQMVANYGDDAEIKSYAVNKIAQVVSLQKSGMAKANDVASQIRGPWADKTPCAYFGVTINGDKELVRLTLGEAKEGITANEDAIYSEKGEIYAFSADGKWRKILGVVSQGQKGTGTIAGKINVEQGEALLSVIKSKYSK